MAKTKKKVALKDKDVSASKAKSVKGGADALSMNFGACGFRSQPANLNFKK